jgi:gamma-glutamyl:cysteine ligase YbdK (ATP-grasp superfamily)
MREKIVALCAVIDPLQLTRVGRPETITALKYYRKMPCMGQEIGTSKFSPGDFANFMQHLQQENSLLRKTFVDAGFSNAGPVGGFEIEAWLVDGEGRADPCNARFLALLNDPLVVPELAAFNFELNVEPGMLQSDVLRQMETGLSRTWQHCRSVAAQLDRHIVMTGILPSVTEAQLTLPFMTQSNRYQALNEQVFRLRNGLPINLHIVGRETLKTEHFDVMLEAGTTSFQIHLQVPFAEAAPAFNRALLYSAPMVAVSANSPFLFGNMLWDETRIPLFEQAVECGELAHRRVTFGDDYIRDSLMECFDANMKCYPVLVPFTMEEGAQQLAHLRFHNGTIWRWNRPLIGFDADGVPHLRLEHRVVPSGPTVVDSIANAALFWGLMSSGELDNAFLLDKFPFSSVRQNFYACARDGLNARVDWPHSTLTDIRELLLKHLLPLAELGLENRSIDKADISHYLGIIRQRVESGQNGAQWQRNWVEANGRNMQALTLAYLQRQDSGIPVGEWAP